MTLVDDHCSRATSKTAAAEDDIKVCAHVDAAQVRLEISWTTREGNRESHVDTNAVVAHGGHVDIDINTAKMVLALQ